MIISGTITLDPAAHAASTAALRLRLERLDDRRRAAERSVAHVLATWHGEAAELFQARWEEWNHGALAVIDHLSVATEFLDHARRDLTGADLHAEQASRQLADRLG